MSLTVYENLEQGTEEWLQTRAGVLTASVIGQLLTPKLAISKSDGAMTLLEKLAVEKATGQIEPVAKTWAMRRGTFLEPFAREEYDMTRATVTQVGFMTRSFDDGGLLGYSPDGLVGEDGLIEIKCLSLMKHRRTILANEVPAEHVAQIQAGLLVSGREWCDYVSFHPGYPTWIIRATPDPAWQEALAEAAVYGTAQIRELADTYRAVTADIPATPFIELDF